MEDNHRIHSTPSPARALAERLVALVHDRDHAAIALSGGRTPRELFELLAGDFRNRIPWERVTLYQVDERGVGPEHPDSNWRLITETILARVPNACGYRMEAERPNAAEAYEKLLKSQLPVTPGGFPIFDLVILGMGPDGHTASLFPNTDALHVTDRAVVRNDVPQLATYRITLTYPTLAAAHHRWFLVQGADKARVFTEVLNGCHPAGKVPNAEWFIDPSLETAKNHFAGSESDVP